MGLTVVSVKHAFSQVLRGGVWLSAPSAFIWLWGVYPPSPSTLAPLLKFAGSIRSVGGLRR